MRCSLQESVDRSIRVEKEEEEEDVMVVAVWHIVVAAGHMVPPLRIKCQI